MIYAQRQFALFEVVMFYKVSVNTALRGNTQVPVSLWSHSHQPVNT